jgi:hypothetical protein
VLFQVEQTLGVFDLGIGGQNQQGHVWVAVPQLLGDA